MNLNIIPECYADTLLVEMLGFERPNHQMGIGTVFKVLSKNFKTRPAVVIVDNDKVKANYFKGFVKQAAFAGIQKWKNPDVPHTLLVLSPAFEGWVFQNAKDKRVYPKKYGFKNQRHFQSACKDEYVSQSQSVKQFLNTLWQKKAPGFLQLQIWIEEALNL